VILSTILHRLAYASKILEPLQSVQGSTVYLVGGILRDMFLDVHTQDKDLDFVIEGHTEHISKEMQNKLGGHLTSHPEFGTFTLKTQGYVLDFVSARSESYRYPGALPTVRFGTIWDDLARRDFTFNALALRLSPLELLDPHQGLDDLQNRLLRILHPDSFLDDPTRIIRGARLAGRLGFKWEAATKGKIAEALTSEALRNISKERLKAEFRLCLTEEQVTPVLHELERCDVLQSYFGLPNNAEIIQNLDHYRRKKVIPDESYLLALLLKLENPEVFLERFHYPMRYLESLRRIKAGLEHLGSELYPKLSQAEIWVLKASGSSVTKQLDNLKTVFSRRRLSGQDVLDLGLLSGPWIGKILARVARARDNHEVSGFEEELELARKLVLAIQEQQ
jgi:tRNA nucleotidyltransferase (CCA-adding enzyme)